MYSAKKIAGRKLYELARQGVAVARQPVNVTIRELEIVGREGSKVRLRVVCSAGRTFGHLPRTSAGRSSLADIWKSFAARVRQVWPVRRGENRSTRGFKRPGRFSHGHLCGRGASAEIYSAARSR